MDSIKFQFTGGMADNHEMNFYEAGRFQYGAARFIYTLEKFRQEGRVVAQLRGKVHADIRIKAAERGSFIQEVIIFAAPVIAECSISCSFQAIFAYVWNLILPPSRANDVAVAIAQQEVKREEQRTLQESERTEQIKLLTQVSLDANATTRQALDVLNYAVENGITIANEDYRLSRNDIESIRDEAASSLDREEIIKENQACLSRISPETERRLAGQLRKSINDLALPLRSSATELFISQGDIQTKKIANLSAGSAQSIAQEDESDETTLIRGSIKAYDVETGYGKFRYDELKRPISFRVPSASKEVLRSKILEAMNKDDVLITAFFVKDSYGNPIRLILDNIHDNETLDDLGFTN